MPAFTELIPICHMLCGNILDYVRLREPVDFIWSAACDFKCLAFTYFILIRLGVLGELRVAHGNSS